MKFLHTSDEPIKGKLVYVDEDRSLDFHPEDEKYKPGSHGPSAALVVSKTLQLEFQTGDGRLLYPWGYLPKESWKHESGKVSIGAITKGGVCVYMDEPPDSGSGYGAALEDSPTRFFVSSGHLVVGDTEGADLFIEIASGVIVGLKGQQLHCLVLRLTK